MESTGRRLWRRLLQPTIWRPGLFDPPDDRYRNLYRVVLPLFDLALIVAGIGAIVYGSPAFSDFTDGLRIFGLAWGIWTTMFAASALVGIVFPKLFLFEGIGKTGVVAATLVYLAVLFLLTTGGSTTRFVATGMSEAALGLAAWRLFDLRIERLHRAAKREAAHREDANPGAGS